MIYKVVKLHICCLKTTSIIENFEMCVTVLHIRSTAHAPKLIFIQIIPTIIFLKKMDKLKIIGSR